MAAPREIQDLVERFSEHIDRYRSKEYNETEVRVHFVNPFFKALGWDVDHEERYEVVHETQVDVEEDGRKRPKHPDYGFRTGTTTRFFVETKKPIVHLKTHAPSAYQVRRYGWSAKLPVCILTDFEEFSVYDCRIKPDQNDSPDKGRLRYYEYTDYLEKWDEIADLFSREAVINNRLEEWVRDEKVRGTQEVDDAFLNELETWRVMLAKDIALHNPRLTRRQINMAVQLTIDRIVFLRICEDREIEAYGHLKSIEERDNIYEWLKKEFQKADKKYNSGLFHFPTGGDPRKTATLNMPSSGKPDNLTLGLTISDAPLRKILVNLYYPTSPYEFSVLPADILGQVYERFLGKVIELSSGGAVEVVEKPEVRKAGGVYYTPTYIVDYIVEHTVGKLVAGKKPKDVAKLRILDPACGSGSFLIGAYDYLLDWHLDYYINDKPEKYVKQNVIREHPDPAQPYALTTEEKKRILLNNLYGVDLDQQAVEVTKLSLLLKTLEGESAKTTQMALFAERVLPDLSENIRWGNSLIGSDFYANKQISMFDDEELYQVNAFDWHSKTEGFGQIMAGGGFDAVIGNPPYDVLEKDRKKSSWPHELLREYASNKSEYEHALGGKLNLFRFFIIKSLSLISVGGRFGMIVPMALLGDISCAKSRLHLMRTSGELRADCFPQKDVRSRRIFRDAKLSTTIITSQKEIKVDDDSAEIFVQVFPWNTFDDEPKSSKIKLLEMRILDPKNIPIPLVSRESWEICIKIYNNSRVKRLGDTKQYKVTRGEINQTIYREFITDNCELIPLLKGVEVGQYRINMDLSQGSREWFDEEMFLLSNNPKPIASHRRIATQRITGVDERLRVVATIIDPKTYFADSTNSIILNDNGDYSLEYLLGLLNSTLFQWRFKLTSTNNNVGTNELDSLPIRTIDFDDPKDVARHDDMVGMVERMLDLHQQRAGASGVGRDTIDRTIASLDRDIDHLVYDLYDLTQKEIKIVEDGA